MTLNELLPRLDGVRRFSDGYKARCPAHDDRNPSLSITEADDGRILLKCMAGCPTETVLAALGLEWSDLFPAKRQAAATQVKHREPKAAPEPSYVYRDTEGKPLFGVIRTPEKKFFQVRPDNKGGWVYGLGAVEPVLYHLPEVMQAAKSGGTVFIVEGEKDADNLTALGLVATTNCGGAGKWRDRYSHALKGAHCIVLPDNDQPGQVHAEQVAVSLYGQAATVKVLNLPDLPPKGDVTDWLVAGGTKEKLLELVHAAPEWTPEARERQQEGSPFEDEKRDRPTHAQILLEIAEAADLFHTSDDEAYASVPINGHSETWPLRSKGFRRWLLQRFHEREGKPPSAQALQDALGVLEAGAYFDGPELPVFTRLAEYDGRIYLDLCNASWEAVEISVAGWQIVGEPPVKFRRTKGMAALPRPEEGGVVADLRPFLNAEDETVWRLLVAWLLAAFKPQGPFPVLVLQGEQGSAKSTTVKVARSLVDPSMSPLRTAPRDERDLAIAANNAWCLAFDNMSGLPLWLSDALCRVASGGGFATRTLYANAEESLFNYTRPIALNGIDEVIGRHDLLDRALVVNLPAIHPRKRLEERAFWADFEAARPKILGAFLDAVSVALLNLPVTDLDRLPRMADFAKWVAAAEAALPWEVGGFLRAYEENRGDAVSLALESDAVATAVMSFVEDRWAGTATELLKALEGQVPEDVRRSKAWPKTPKTLGNRLRRAATFLRHSGIEVETGRAREGGTGRRLIRIERFSTVTTVTTVTNSPNAAPLGVTQSVTQNILTPEIVTTSSQAEGQVDDGL